MKRFNANMNEDKVLDNMAQILNVSKSVINKVSTLQRDVQLQNIMEQRGNDEIAYSIPHVGTIVFTYDGGTVESKSFVPCKEFITDIQNIFENNESKLSLEVEDKVGKLLGEGFMEMYGGFE